MPGMPNGKPAGVPCANLDADMRCMIFGSPLRPACCSGLKPSDEMCGNSRTDAIAWLTHLEEASSP